MNRMTDAQRATKPVSFITEEGLLGINWGGMVFVKSVADWHRIAQQKQIELDEFRASIIEMAKSA